MAPPVGSLAVVHQSAPDFPGDAQSVGCEKAIAGGREPGHQLAHFQSDDAGDVFPQATLRQSAGDGILKKARM